MRYLFIVAIAGAAASAPAQVVDIDGRTDCFGVRGAATVPLDAGVYILRPVGPPEGAYTAWNAWAGGVGGCEPGGSGCTQGWMHSYIVATDRHLFNTTSARWSTSAAALAAAAPAQLRLCEAATVRFFVGDDHCPDNVGGASIRIEPAPCPPDLDLDGSLDFFDFLLFQDLFAAGDSRTDIDCSGELDFFDFLAFQNVYTAGC